MYPEIKGRRPWRGDVFYEHIDRGIRSLYEEGCRYRVLFERNIGMPPDHFCAIAEGLAQLAFRNQTYGYQYSWWFAVTGTMLALQTDLKGGALLEEAAKALVTYYPDFTGSTDLAASLNTFVAIASSAGKPGGIRLRGMQPTYLLLGENHHEVWIVDFCGSMAFAQDIMDRFGVSKDSVTADPPNDDAFVRTSVFDAELARFLETVDGVELAFSELRPKQGLPNVKFELPEGREQEVDVPLRVGDVFVPIQTWTSVGEAGVDEGEYEPLRRRWKAVKNKLRRTDELYGDRLRDAPKARGYLRSHGIHYILPIFCTPHPEPVATDRPKYWLRPVSEDTVRSIQRDRYKAVPRILTGTQLADFLRTASKEELASISTANGWAL